MLTINAILKEINNVPLDRLEELYQFVNSLTSKARRSEAIRKKILSFREAFSEMTKEDYDDFHNYIKKTRNGISKRVTIGHQ